MSIYERYKRGPEGFRALVELLEVTPIERREKMLEAGMEEDPAFTERAIQLMLSFEDVLRLPEMELSELLATVPPNLCAIALCRQPKEVQKRFLLAMPPKAMGEFRDLVSEVAELRDIGGAQLKMIQATRELERKGYVKTKRIPLSSE